MHMQKGYEYPPGLGQCFQDKVHNRPQLVLQMAAGTRVHAFHRNPSQRRLFHALTWSSES